ncbi:MAG: tRNA 2-selenouridine(34) synthase MnmH [Rhodobacteraceae bacterium]|nr:tRNA 2-selenouridine(34) synthase MnmH [Paracoccaceae bacterium]
MLRVTLSSLSDLDALPFDEVIDARSPAEFAEDHLPGAINLPVLDNAERAEVGTIYVQDSRFRARRLGAALVARNVARHLQTALADKPADYRPLVYCWRGGQRSGSFAMILGQIGWQVGVLDGGWKAWRRLVQQAFYDAPFPVPVTVLDGNTGTAKTAILHKVAERGGQVIDLEGLARHRGSLFGLVPGDEQPTQKRFESALAEVVMHLDPTRPVLVEAESNRIGALRLPPSLWQAMQAAPRIALEAPVEARANWLTQAYGDIIAAPEELAARIAALAPFQPRDTVAEWQALARGRQFEALAARLMREHYDPRYERTALRQDRAPDAVLRTDSLDVAAQEILAGQIVAHLG